MLQFVKFTLIDEQTVELKLPNGPGLYQILAVVIPISPTDPPSLITISPTDIEDNSDQSPVILEVNKPFQFTRRIGLYSTWTLYSGLYGNTVYLSLERISD